MARISKVSIKRSEAIEQIVQLIAEDLASNSKSTIAGMIAELLINGSYGYKNKLNMELIQELEGSVFYGQNVEITIINDLPVGEFK